MVALLPLFLACTPAKLLRLENELLKSEVVRLESSVAECSLNHGPEDFATHVNVELVQSYLTRAGYAPESTNVPTILAFAVKGTHTSFRVNVQLFERENVLFLAVADYVEIEQATSSSAMVLLLTQLAALNYELLLGKFQLNPTNGQISLSVELSLEDGLGYKTFEATLHHLLQTADAKYPDLMQAAEGRGL